MKTLAIIKTGSTLPSIKQQFGDFEDWFIQACGLPNSVVTIINAADSAPLPRTANLSGAIITGSPAMVTDQAEWMLALMVWIPQLVEQQIPILGVCFGHQLLAQAMGGAVDYHPQGREIGTVAIRLTDEGQQDHLLGELSAEFMAHTTHAQTVTTLPLSAIRLASNSFENNHAFRIGHCAWGVQFHPEFSAEVMKGYIDGQAESLREKGYDLQELYEGIAQTPAANSLLRRFTGMLVWE